MLPAKFGVVILITLVLKPSRTLSQLECTFHDGKVLCNNRSLLEIPSAIKIWMPPEEITSLDLSNNYIQAITNSSLSLYPRLQELIIRNSGLSSVQPGAFSNLTELRRLDLSDNFLTRFHFDLLAPCKQIESVSLANNLLEDLDSFNATNLKYLDVSNNRLSYIPEDVRRQLDKVNDFILEVTNNPWNCSKDEWGRYLEEQNLTDVMCTMEYVMIYRVEQERPARRNGIGLTKSQNADVTIALWIVLSIVAGAVAGNADRIYYGLTARAKNTSRRNGPGKREEEFTLKANA